MSLLDNYINNMKLNDLATIPDGQLENKYHIKKIESKLPSQLTEWLREKGYNPKIKRQKIGGGVTLHYTDRRNHVRIDPQAKPEIKYMAGGRPGKINSYDAKELETAIDGNIAAVCRKHEVLVNRFGDKIAKLLPQENWELNLSHQGSDNEIKIVESPYNVLDCTSFFSCGLDHNYQIAELENPELKYYLASNRYSYDRRYEDVGFLINVTKKKMRLAWYCNFDLRCGTLYDHNSKKEIKVNAIDIRKFTENTGYGYNKNHDYLIISEEFKMTSNEVKTAGKGIARMVKAFKKS